MLERTKTTVIMMTLYWTGYILPTVCTYSYYSFMVHQSDAPMFWRR